ncbi:MAG TPA: type II toxin-antitoxin system prevent-host-death family antitoxin [Myxococcaceae bacterium]|nr:type II toxin-antitoxin system prevent-host-death family antitoxin [Myxococcaceae bacterium]
MKRVTTHQAKTHLSQLLAEVEKGEEILVCRGKRVVARLVSAKDKDSPRRPRVGTVTSGPVKVSEGAFNPLAGSALKEWGI